MLGHLIDAFLLSSVRLATDSERKRNSNPRKIYPADPGLIHAFDASGRSNVGHALETAILNEIERRRADVGYARTSEGLEVDFLVRYPPGVTELIQVCADPAGERTRGRELRALTSAASEEHQRARKRLLVLTHDQLRYSADIDADVQPTYEWMLTEPDKD